MPPWQKVQAKGGGGLIPKIIVNVIVGVLKKGMRPKIKKGLA